MNNDRIIVAREQLRHALRLCLLLLALTTAGMARAGAVDLAALADGNDIALQTQIMYEQAGQPLDISQALASRSWQPASPDKLRSILNRSTLWLSLMVTNNSAEAVQRLVSVGYWRLLDVQMFLVDPDTGVVKKHMFDGLQRHFSQPASTAPGVLASFPVDLAPAERVRMVLRIYSGGWRGIEVKVWAPERYISSVYTDYIIHGALAGFAGALVILLLVTRRAINIWLALWLVTTIAFGAGMQGILAPLTPEWFVGKRNVALIASLSLWNSTLLMLVTGMLVKATRRNPWRYVLAGLVVFAACMTVFFAFVDALVVRRTNASLLFALLLLWPLLIAHSSQRFRHGGNALRALLTLSWVLMVVRLLSYVTGALAQYEASMYVFMIYAQVALVLAIIVKALIDQRNRERRTGEWIRHGGRRQRERLAAQVRERTALLEGTMLAAQEANKAKTEFLGQVSHDLRSPLATIVGYAQLMQADAGSGSSHAGVVRRNAEHMLHMIDDLVDYARDAGSVYADPQPLYLYWLISVIEQHAKTLAATNHNQFELNVRNELPPVVVADGARLRRILVNLLDNAAKFTSDGKIVLSISSEPGVAPGQIRMTFVVSDTGQGMHQDEQAKVFEPFFRGRDSQSIEGTGLGMRIVAMWVERMGGTLSLSSVLGQGTEVAFTLPLTIDLEEAITAPEADLASHVDVDGDGRHIWVVDDVQAIRRLIADRLRRRGFVVHVSSDGLELIEKMHKADAVRPDAVLTDYFMPGANGEAVLEAVRGHWPGVPVVLLTSMQMPLEVEDPDRTGRFDACLSKPVDFSLLSKVLADLLGLHGAVIDQPDLVPDTPSGDGGVTQRDDDVSSPGMGAARPPQHRLDELSALASLGAISDIGDWCTAVLAEQPRCEAFVQQVQRMVQSLQLDGIVALAARIPR